MFESIDQYFKNKIRRRQETIGEAYLGFFRGMATCGFCVPETAFVPGQRVTLDFYTFKPSDITTMERNRIMIWGTWVPLDDIIFKGEEGKKPAILERYSQLRDDIKAESIWCYEKEREIRLRNPVRSIFG